MSTEYLIFNGINGATGSYLTPSLTPQQVTKIALGKKLAPAFLSELQYKKRQFTGLEPSFAPKEGVDPKNLAETGWGVIFAHGTDPQVREALRELIEHRRKQATEKDERCFKICTYRPDESKSRFLAREGSIGPGPVDPQRMPYYLMIVGDPETIPYSFQYQLDVQYAVGRIHFNTVEEYAQYAHSVVEAETKQLALPRRASFFGVRNSDDPATQLSAEYLVKPLADSMLCDKTDWVIQTVLNEKATKNRLGQLLGGIETPALLFTACHGIGFPNGDDRQLHHQGALLCQDWPGPQEWQQPIPEDYYLAADDIGSDARLWGLIAFHFACYGAGTPRTDDFAHQAFDGRQEIAPHAFISHLSQRLLSHPKGGALAVVGHVERAWGCSFLWENAGSQLEVFKSSLKRLMEGHPVGSAFEYFNERYAELSSDLSVQLEEARFAESPDHIDHIHITGMWTASNDARNYSIIGDPAVKLMVGSSSKQAVERPTISRIILPTNVAHPSSIPFPNQSIEESSVTTKVSAELPVAGNVDFGLKEIFNAPALKQAQEQLAEALKQFCDKLGTTLTDAVSDATSLQVSTYVSDNLAQVSYNTMTRQFEGAKLRALSRIKLDGDTQVCVSEEDGEFDEMLWKIHADTVQQAQSQRTELIKTVASAATGLLQSMKGL